MLEGRRLKVEVIGLGKAGLPLAAIIADAGFDVVGMDVNQQHVAQINAGKNPFSEEPSLDALIQRYGGKKIKATANAGQAAKECNVHIILVPLLLDGKNRPDFRYLDAAISGMLDGLKKGDIVIVETTLPPGALENHVKPLVEGGGWKAGKDIFLAYSPERLMSGFAVSRFKEFPKIIGGVDGVSGEEAYEIYRKFVPQVKLVSNAKVAEMTKVAEGIYRDVNIALANELFKLCEKNGIDFNEVRKYANHEFCNIHEAGVGVGGHCIPVYPHFLIGMDPKGTPLTRLSREINDGMIEYWIEQITWGLKKSGGKEVCIRGLTYRPGVKEFYHSRALALAQRLKEKGLQVYAWDSLLSQKEIEALGLNYKKPQDCKYVFDAHKAGRG